jgi:hypothetical protein
MDTEAADELLNDPEKEVFENMLGRQPDENDKTDLIQMVYESSEDF